MFEKFIQAVRAGILSVSEDYTNRLKIEGKDVGSIQGQLKVNIVDRKEGVFRLRTIVGAYRI